MTTVSSVVLTLLFSHTEGADRQGVFHPGHPGLQSLLLILSLLLLFLVRLLLFLLSLGLALLDVDVAQTVQPDCK